MKKSLLFFVALLVLCLFAGGVSAYSGSGTADNPFILSSASDLQLLSGTGIAVTPFSVSAYYELGADIDMSSVANFEPIGTGSYRFQGSFDGKNHTISNMNVYRNTYNCGLFAFTAGTSTIKNMIFYNSSVSSSYGNTAILVGNTELSVSLKIDNVKVFNCNITSYNYNGGLIGRARNVTILHSNVENSIIHTTSSNSRIGSFCGVMAESGNSTFQYCISKNNYLLSTPAGYYSGGIFAIAYLGHSVTVSDCIVDSCTIKSGDNIGGIFGAYKASDTTPPIISNCSVSNCVLYGNGLICGIGSSTGT